MKWPLAALIVVFAATDSAAAQAGDALTNGIVIIRGCVVAGTEPNTYLLNHVAEVKRDGKLETPRNLSRPVIYWLSDATRLRSHVGRRVELSGRITGLEQREAEVRLGPQNDGTLVVRIEGPGRDIRTTLSAIEGAVGTSGTEAIRSAPGPTDIATAVLKVDVGHLRAIEGYCR